MTMTYSSSVAHGGYVCAKCGWLVPNGNAHFCTTAGAWPTSSGWMCCICGSWVSDFHICPGRGSALPHFGTQTLTGSPCPDCGLQVETGSQHDCPSAHPGPETPLAEATAKLCGWLARAQAWLERNRL